MIIVTVDFEAMKELSTLFNGSENSNLEWYFIIVSFIEEEANIMVDILWAMKEVKELRNRSYKLFLLFGFQEVVIIPIREWKWIALAIFLQAGK